MRRPKAIEKIKDVLRTVAPAAEIILYGSEARGESRADSDFDILILEDVDKISYQRRVEIEGPLFDLFLSDGIDVSPMLMTKKQWENRPFLTPFYINIINEGIRL